MFPYLLSLSFAVLIGGEQLSCDLIAFNNTCIVHSDTEFSGNIDIFPQTLVLEHGIKSESITQLTIASGAKLRCYGDLCGINIRYFANVSE